MNAYLLPKAFGGAAAVAYLVDEGKAVRLSPVGASGPALKLTAEELGRLIAMVAPELSLAELQALREPLNQAIMVEVRDAALLQYQVVLNEPNAGIDGIDGAVGGGVASAASVAEVDAAQRTVADTAADTVADAARRTVTALEQAARRPGAARQAAVGRASAGGLL